MPEITENRIIFTTLDRQAIGEQSPGITTDYYVSIFQKAIEQGDTMHLFKFFEEIAEKDPDILHSLETRTSYITSKEWYIEGENQRNSERIEDLIRNIKGDPSEGLMSTDQMINSLLNDSYLIGLSFAEVVSDEKRIIGFNHIPAHFLTFRESVNYPKLWTQQNPLGEAFNKEKMISHYLHHGSDPTRGWLGHCVGWLYVQKRLGIDAKLEFQKKYGKGFLLVNMPGDRDSYLEAWVTAENLIQQYANVDGAVFPGGVDVDFKETNGSLDGEFFFDQEDNIKKAIVQVILGQDSTSSSESSNRSTAEVHLEILEQRIIDDIAAIEDTLTKQLVEKVKILLGIPQDSLYEFKFEKSEIEEQIEEETTQEPEEPVTTQEMPDAEEE